MSEFDGFRSLLLELHGSASVRLLARLEGMSDEEYLWEPAPGCWSVRPVAGDSFAPDLTRPHPEPPPLTTIAWLMWHLSLELPPAAGSVDESVERYFEAGPLSTPPAWPGSAAEATALLAETLQSTGAFWASLSSADCEVKLGDVARGHRDSTFRQLLSHAVDELVHHAAEIGRMRDLYRALRGVEVKV